MKTKLCIILLAFIGALGFGPSAFAIDPIIHDIVDHTIGRGHHRNYYSYGHGHGHYRQPHYTHTRASWSGGHRRHHARGREHFGVRRGDGHDRGNRRGH